MELTMQSVPVRLLFPVLTALALASPALAAEEVQAPSAGPPAAWASGGKWAPDRVTIGFGGGIGPDYSGSNDDDVVRG